MRPMMLADLRHTMRFDCQSYMYFRIQCYAQSPSAALTKYPTRNPSVFIASYDPPLRAPTVTASCRHFLLLSLS